MNISHLVVSARLLMQGHGLKAIPVLENDNVVGMVTLERALHSADDAVVSSVMSQPMLTLDGTSSILKAAQSFYEKDLDYAPVMENGRLKGLLTTQILLKELRRTWDPLSGLGWSDRLREWGMEMLTSGREICILFIDIDKFGEYNKKHGHLVGDRVLQRVAAMLRNSVDPKKDVLVRYGGDEFAIGTIRTHDDALRLREELHSAVVELFIDNQSQSVSFSVGVSGGRRTKLREDAHVASMLDELITAASKDALGRKKDAVGPVLNVIASEALATGTEDGKDSGFKPRFDPS